jgi:hypothetical protein
VSPVKYNWGFYIPEDILHSHRRENLTSYIALLWLRCMFYVFGGGGVQKEECVEVVVMAVPYVHTA